MTLAMRGSVKESLSTCKEDRSSSVSMRKSSSRVEICMRHTKPRYDRNAWHSRSIANSDTVTSRARSCCSAAFVSTHVQGVACRGM